MASPLSSPHPMANSESFGNHGNMMAHDHGQDHRPHKPSPLILSPMPVKLSVPESSENQRSEGPGQEPELDANGKPQRQGKGKRYKDFIAENGIKPIKKDRKVLFSLYPTIPSFYDSEVISPLKTLWKREKMLVSSIFSISHNVFNSIRYKNHFSLIYFYYVF